MMFNPHPLAEEGATIAAHVIAHLGRVVSIPTPSEKGVQPYCVSAPELRRTFQCPHEQWRALGMFLARGGAQVQR